MNGRGVVRLTRERHEGKVLIQSKRQHEDGTPHWRQPHYMTVLKVDEECQVAVEIDVDGILRSLGVKAAKNKTGKAGAMGGLVKVRVLTRKVLAEKRTENPIPDYAEPTKVAA